MTIDTEEVRDTIKESFIRIAHHYQMAHLRALCNRNQKLMRLLV